VINADDPYGQLIRQINPGSVWRYGVHDPTDSDLWMSDLSYEPAGVSGVLHTPKGVPFAHLIGQYNLANLLAAVGAVLHLGIDLQLIASVLPQFPGVPGRMEQVQLARRILV